MKKIEYLRVIALVNFVNLLGELKLTDWQVVKLQMSLITKVLKKYFQFKGHKNKWYFTKTLSSFISKQEGEEA